ncbi:MAG: hypothetical protein DIU55_007350 [Bacillota bacterium]
MENLVERVLNHSARITALEEWQKRQNGHLYQIESKVTDLQETVMALNGKITDIHKQNSNIFLSVCLALLALVGNLIVMLARG